MVYLSVSYNYSPAFDSPESWFKRTEGYAGIMECLSKAHTVINVKQIRYTGSQFHNGVQYHFVNFGKKDTWFPWRLNHFIKNLKPDIVIIQGLHHSLQLIHLHFLLNKNTKIIAHHHAEKPFTGIKKYIQRIADRFVGVYLFASQVMGMEWVNKGNLVSAKKIHEVMEVSSNFYPIKKADAKLKTGIEGDPIFLWVGRLNDNKAPLNVVRAFLRYSETSPGSRLYMIYHTDELIGGIKELISNSPVKNKIILVGKTPHDDLLYWFNSADFFISGSHYEGSGTALCEAMSCGCIPIVTDIFSFRMITDNGNCGILYEAGNEAALLSALIQTKDLDIDEKRGKSLEYFREKLSFEAIAKRIEEIAGYL
ncbi:MAG TPA: glycosyltransferase family 4 protein [Mucilaginibacter sp.]|jgi:glycosyltransferase involved in cell wall biosynthesis